MRSVALVGMPNVGKTALFNALTGSFQKVANFPGVTVERKSAQLLSLPDVEVVDLPGLYSLDIATLDEKVTRDFLTGKNGAAGALVVVVDATNLQKSLYLLLQLLELGHRPLIALTQMDQSHRRGQVLDLEKFSALSGCEVLPVSAMSGEGVKELRQHLGEKAHLKSTELVVPPAHQKRIKEPDYVSAKFRQIDDWIGQIVLTSPKPDTLTARFDRWALHPFWGPLLLIVILLMMFQALFSWAGPLQDLIEAGMGALGSFAESLISLPILRSFVVDGLIGGVGSVVVFLPQILLLFFFVQLLEDAGYLGRAAFLMDGFMRKLGLPGKAMVPLLSSHACAIPGILSTRILEDRRERLITMLVIPLTTCSARLPVYTLLVAAIIPDRHLGFLSWRGLTLAGLYAFAMATALLVAFVLRKTLPREAPSMLLMELPPYRWPRPAHLWRSMMNKARVFLGNAGKVILVVSLVIWVLVSFPRTSLGDAPPISDSFAAMIGNTAEPIFRPLGFDWRINTALIPAFAAREVVVAALGTVFAVGGQRDGVDQSLGDILSAAYPAATLVALLIWFAFAPQCVSTFAVLRRESGGWAVPIGMLTYTLALAWLAAFAAHALVA